MSNNKGRTRMTVGAAAQVSPIINLVPLKTTNGTKTLSLKVKDHNSNNKNTSMVILVTVM